MRTEEAIRDILIIKGTVVLCTFGNALIFCSLKDIAYKKFELFPSLQSLTLINKKQFVVGTYGHSVFVCCFRNRKS